MEPRMKASAQRNMMLPFRINTANVFLIESRKAAAFDDGDAGATIVSVFCDMHSAVVCSSSCDFLGIALYGPCKS